MIFCSNLYQERFFCQPLSSIWQHSGLQNNTYIRTYINQYFCKNMSLYAVKILVLFSALTTKYFWIYRKTNLMNIYQVLVTVNNLHWLFLCAVFLQEEAAFGSSQCSILCNSKKFMSPKLCVPRLVLASIYTGSLDNLLVVCMCPGLQSELWVLNYSNSPFSIWIPENPTVSFPFESTVYRRSDVNRTRIYRFILERCKLNVSSDKIYALREGK